MSLARPISRRWLMDGFCWYARKMIRRSFHVFAVDVSTLNYASMDKNVPLVIMSNHPGWWDPIVGMMLCRECFADRVFYAPIDAEALKKYRIFQKLGYFGIQANTRQGAADFIEQSKYVLSSEASSLWITPEGRFTDVRDHRQPFMPGLAHIASKTPNIHCVPLAIEYAFTEERLPLLLCKLGSPLIDTEPVKRDKLEWQVRLTEHLRATQSALAKSVIEKRWDSFDVLVRPHRKPTSLYDWMRWSLMRLTGQKPTIQHGDSFSPK